MAFSGAHRALFAIVADCQVVADYAARDSTQKRMVVREMSCHAAHDRASQAPASVCASSVASQGEGEDPRQALGAPQLVAEWGWAEFTASGRAAAGVIQGTAA